MAVKPSSKSRAHRPKDRHKESLKTPLSKYLSGYAEPEVSHLTSFPADRTYHHAVLIPAYREDTAFLERLDANLPNSQGKILLVLISNHPLDLSIAEKEEATSAHLALEETLGAAKWQAAFLALYERNGYDVLLVDRTASRAIPNNEGVGLARKTGADIIASLFNKQTLLSPWIMSSDADAVLPPDYFSIEPDLVKNVSAITYPFEHICDETLLGKSTALYEKSIKHYVNGLLYAGSEYAFPTLGSALAFHVESYAKVRGFPKRSAGEDFYLLNKLAKTGAIQASVHLPKIKILARASNRVPFGTGPAVSKLLNSQNMYDEPVFYHPAVFNELKQVLKALKQQPMLLEGTHLTEASTAALLNLGIEKAFRHAVKQNLTGIQYDTHMKSWFDGFRTLKFIHYLRDSYKNKNGVGYPSLSYRQFKVFENQG